MKRPNILLFTIDCLRYDRCGFDDHDRNTTPTLDWLAQEATVFDAAVAPGPRTSESVPGILGGVLSADCLFFDELPYKAIPPENPTIATWLGDHGYRTIAAVANPQLSPIRNFDRGFDEFANLRIENEGDRFEKAQGSDDESDGLRRRLAAVRGRLRDPVRKRIRETGGRLTDPASLAFLLERTIRRRQGWPTVPGEDVITRLLSMLDTTAGDRPVFAWTHLNDLHAPLHPERVREGDLLADASNLSQYRWDSRRVADRYEPNYAAMYESTLRYIDAQIERAVDYLQSKGLWDNTIVVVTADHGEALHDRGVYGHAAGNDRFVHDSTRDYMYEELLHVPLLIRKPNGSGERVRTPFSLVWLHELLAEVTAIEGAAFPRQSGRDSHRDAERDVPLIADAISASGHTIVAREGRIKRISQCLGGDRGSLHAGPLVFDVAVDPGERIDLSDVRETPALDELTEQVFTLPDTLREVGGEIDTETRELLEQLGYQ